MTLATAPTWCLVILALLLLAAAIEDMIRLRISNITNLAILILGLVALTLAGLRAEMWQNAAVFVALLAVGTMLFAAGKLGGGDVKLLAVSGLWFDLRDSLWMLAMVAVAGGVLALLILLLRAAGGRNKDAKAVILRPGSGIPYGVAIAVGVGLTLWLQRPDAPSRPDPFAVPAVKQAIVVEKMAPRVGFEPTTK